MTPIRVTTALIAAAGLSACTTPVSRPTPSKAVADALAERDTVPGAVCPPLIASASVGFGFGDGTLADIATPPLDNIVHLLTCHPQARATIVGEADNHGTEAEQRALAQARIRSVAAYLAAHGVAAERITQQVEGKAPAGGDGQLIVIAEGRRW